MQFLFSFLLLLLTSSLVFAAPSYDVTTSIIPPQPPTASPTPDSAGFVTRISGDGKNIIIGGQYYNNFVGAVWIYTLNSSNQWQQIGQTLTGTSSGSRFGRAVALNANGSVAAVGAFGSNKVYIYKVNLVTWTITSVQTLTGANHFGIDVSFNALGTILAVRTETNGVSPYIYSSNSWIRASSSHLTAPSINSHPASIALSSDGTTMIIGSYNVSNIVVYSSSDNGLTWGNMVALQTPSTSGLFGYSVAISSDGNVAAVGASGANAYMYSRTNGKWSTYLSIPLPNGDVTGFGASVSMNYDGTIVAVGAPGINNYIGMVFVYRCSNITCVLQANYTTPTNLLKQIGSSVSFSQDGAILAVGAPCGPISAITSEQGGNGTVLENPIGGILVLDAATKFPTVSPTTSPSSSPSSSPTTSPSSSPSSSPTTSPSSSPTTSPSSSPTTSSPTMSPVHGCSPVLKTKKTECQKMIRTCEKGHNIKMKWNGKSCPGLSGDSGCQCDQYCGYSCVHACEHDKQCHWKYNQCFNKLTNQPGFPIPHCSTSG